MSSVDHQIDLLNTTIGTHAVHILSSMMTKWVNLDYLRFLNSSLNDKLVGILSENLEGKRLHVRIISEASSSISKLSDTYLNSSILQVTV